MVTHTEGSELRVLRALLHGSVLHPSTCMRFCSSPGSRGHHEFSQSTPHLGYSGNIYFKIVAANAEDPSLDAASHGDRQARTGRTGRPQHGS